MREKYVYFQHNSAASRSFTPAGSDNITVTAVDKTARGNLVSIQVRHDDAAGTVTVTDKAIRIGVGGGADQGADNILTAFNGSAEATALASMTVTGTAHVGSTYDSGQLFLSGGELGVSFPLSSFAGMHPTDDDDLVLYFKSLKNFDGTTSGANQVVKSDSVKLKLIDGNSIREAMDDICKAFNSSRTRPFDIVIGDNRADDVQKISSYISSVEVTTIDGANT